MEPREIKAILDSAGCPVLRGYTDEAAEHEPPYIVWREKIETEFLGNCAIVEVVFRTRAHNDPHFTALKETLAENGIVFSFESSFDEKNKTITRKAVICLPNAEIELMKVYYDSDELGRQAPVVIDERHVPCVIVEETANRGNAGGAWLSKRITARVSERLYNGEEYGLLWRGKTPYKLDSSRNSLNGGARQTDVGYLDLTFKEVWNDKL